MAEPVSWLMIESGWELVDRSGEPLGEITAVVGDADADIFDGLRFETPGGDERYVRAELIGEITEGRVEVDAGPAELERESEEEGPGGVELRRDRGSEL
jgi:hypothetical protein